MSAGKDLVPAAASAPPATVRDLLGRTSFATEIARVLPRTISPDRFVRLALSAINRVPLLAECTVSSVAQCLMDCAQLGLEPGGPLGRAYLIPFQDRKKGVTVCTLVIGYKGLLELAFRGGKLLGIRAEVVREGDDFEVEYGLDDRLVHRPKFGDGRITHAYAVARLEGGATVWTVMSRRELDAIRARSRASDSGPWTTDPAEMCRKTVLRRLCKLLPMACEADLAIEAEDRSHHMAGAYTDALAAPSTPISLPTQAPAGLTQAEILAAPATAPEAAAEAAAQATAPATPPPVEVAKPQAQPEPVSNEQATPVSHMEDVNQLAAVVIDLASSKGLTGARWGAFVRGTAKEVGVTLPEGKLPACSTLPAPLLKALIAGLEGGKA